MSWFEFATPWAFLGALPLLALALWRWRRRGRGARLAWSSLRGLPARRGWRARLAWTPGALAALGLAALLVALARPREGLARTRVEEQGLAIGLVLDRSASMDEPIEDAAGQERSKLDVVKQTVARFVAGDDARPGRRGDLLGLVAFARHPEEACPPVTSPEPLLAAVDALRPVAPFLDAARRPTFDRREAAAQNPLSATAIGDALNRAVLSLAAAGAGADADGADAGKVVILLTDGENNAGVDPRAAAELAKENGVKVYSILFCERSRELVTPFGERVRVPLDDQELARRMEAPRELAQTTGGAAFFASDGAALDAVYQRIDALERIELGRVETTTFQERFALPLALGLCALCAACALESTVFRRLP
ncbi:MAG: VWA domain-containing protein [Planctomycetota bacterium]